MLVNKFFVGPAAKSTRLLVLIFLLSVVSVIMEDPQKVFIWLIEFVVEVIYTWGEL